MGGAAISSLLSSFQVITKDQDRFKLQTLSGAYCPDRLEEGGGPEDPHPLQLAVLEPPEVPSLLLHQPPDGHAASQPHRPTHPPLPGVGHALPLLGPCHPSLRPDVAGPHLALLLPRLLLLPAS